MLETNKVTNANVYLDGASQLGRVEEVTLPEIAWKMTEHKAIGMIGTTEYFSGVEKMEASFKWASFYAEVYRATVDPTKTIAIQVRSSVESWGAEGRADQKPLVVFLRGRFKTVAAGVFKQQDNAEFPQKFAIDYIKIEIDEETLIEIDIPNNILIVNGEDLLEQYRANLGI